MRTRGSSSTEDFESLDNRDSNHLESEALWAVFAAGQDSGAAASANGVLGLLSRCWDRPQDVETILRWLEQGLEPGAVDRVRRVAQAKEFPGDPDGAPTEEP